ncbi:MAG TPA: phosphoserine phosphatase SerB [Aliiroseovarius sp.]|nr:phosphoserine phosphatase SerB [Aliiroseovarius sp.]
MFVATMLTNPARPTLDAAAVESLRDAWGGGDARWLAPGEAAEFDLEVTPENLWQVWEDLQALGIDLTVQKAAGRRRKMLLADMDSTMIGQECIDELADAAGVGERVKEITARAMNGELDFDGALRERVGLMAGLDARIIDEVLESRITLAKGGPALVATMRTNGAHTALVSGGFMAFAVPVAARLGFDDVQANELFSEGGKLTGKVGEPILGRAAKVEALETITARLGNTTEEVMAVGDGAHDLGMLHAAGAGVALHAKPAVAAEGDLRINHGDLTALLYLQGYAKNEFTV